jgi:protein TonB
VAAEAGLRSPFVSSMVLHGGVLGAVLLYSFVWGRVSETWGEKDALPGGGVTITAVSKIPMIQRPGPTRKVANDSEATVPEPVVKPKPKPSERERAPEPDAIPLRSKRDQKQREYESPSRYRPEEEPKPNQATSTVGAAARSAMFGVQGSGNIGPGSGMPFGNRLGWYADLLRRKVAENWRTNDVDARLKSAPVAIVTFDIVRDGTVRNVKLLQSSGILALDYSAQRAIRESSPFQPLPREYEREVATIEFWFELKR